MKEFRNFLFLIGFGLMLAAPAQAGGSFRVDIELKPILDQAPVIERFFFGAFDFDPSGWANRIGNNVNAHLGGTRLGPYCVRAKPKGATGSYTLQVCVNTEYHFFDPQGKACELPVAVRVEEKFLSLEVKPWNEEK